MRLRWTFHPLLPTMSLSTSEAIRLNQKIKKPMMPGFLIFWLRPDCLRCRVTDAFFVNKTSSKHSGCIRGVFIFRLRPDCFRCRVTDVFLQIRPRANTLIASEACAFFLRPCPALSWFTQHKPKKSRHLLHKNITVAMSLAWECWGKALRGCCACARRSIWRN